MIDGPAHHRRPPPVRREGRHVHRHAEHRPSLALGTRRLAHPPVDRLQGPFARQRRAKSASSDKLPIFQGLGGKAVRRRRQRPGLQGHAVGQGRERGHGGRGRGHRSRWPAGKTEAWPWECESWARDASSSSARPSGDMARIWAARARGGRPASSRCSSNGCSADLGVRRTANASTPEVYARKVVTKNGWQEWLIALNTTSLNMKADLGFAVSAETGRGAGT